MENYSKDFSIIIPVWSGAIRFLPKLFDSIPKKDGIEIIVVDNSKEPVSREDIQTEREIVLLHSAHERHAGGSRNDGIAVANGKWLLFADADDYFSDAAFEIFYSMIDSDAEVIYSGMGGVYSDTGEPSDRGNKYLKVVHDYLNGDIPEMYLRLHFSSPCCKMVSHDLVNRHNIRFDEVRASNDMFFSMLIGFYAISIAAIDKVTYIASVNKGSLTRRKDFDVSISRFMVLLRYNLFLRKHNLSEYQSSIMYRYKEVCVHGLKPTLKATALIFQFRQNPFIGWKNWSNSFARTKEREEKERDYIVH